MGWDHLLFFFFFFHLDTFGMSWEMWPHVVQQEVAQGTPIKLVPRFDAILVDHDRIFPSQARQEHGTRLNYRPHKAHILQKRFFIIF